MLFTKKRPISLTNVRINKKTFGVKLHRQRYSTFVQCTNVNTALYSVEGQLPGWAERGGSCHRIYFHLINQLQ